MNRTAVGRLVLGVVAVGVTAGLLYGAAGFFLAPRLVESRLAAMAEERLGHAFSVETLKVNPFALSVEAAGVRLAQTDGSPVVSARRVYLNLSLLGSGFGRGWVLSEAQTDGLQAEVILRRDGRLNLAGLLQRWRQGADPAKPGRAPVPVTVKHLVATDGQLTYRDLSDASSTTIVMPVRLELVNVSTLPDREGSYAVSAGFVDGGELTWHGKMSMPLQMEGDLTLQDVNLATIWKFFRDDLRIAKPEGVLSLATHSRFSYAGGKPELALEQLRLKASALQLMREGFEAPMVALKTLEVFDGTFHLGERALVLPTVTLTDGAVTVVKDGTGTWNWTGLVVRKGSSGRSEDNRQAAPAWRIDMNTVNAGNVAVHFEDRTRPGTLAVETSAVHGSATVLWTLGGGEPPGVRANDIKLRVEHLRLPAPDTPEIRLTEVQVEGGYVDRFKREVGATRLAAKGGTVRVERSAAGEFPIGQRFASASGAQPSTTPWRFAVGALRADGLDVELSDRSSGERAITHRLDGVSASIDNFTRAGAEPMAFRASAGTGGAGSIAASGSAAPDLSRVDARIKLTTLTLSALQPYITRFASVDLVSGSVSASAALAYRREGSKTSLSLRGPFELANVRLNKSGTGETVLAWARLAGADARLALSPGRVSIEQIVVEAPVATIAISESRELNILQLFKKTAAPDNPKPPSGNGDAKSSALAMHIGELRVRDGTLDFSDSSLVLPFSARVTNLTGAVAGLDSRPDRLATLQFEGKVGESGSADIGGRIDALSPKTFTDINVKFENVDFPDLSPYSATFLGRRIASGVLWADLGYRIADGQLDGDNDISIRDLKLGEPVDTPTALRLPLDLAVALLTDSEGRISLAVPVTGDMNKPEFDIGGLIREALGNVIKKIVSAPFRAFAGLFGKDSDTKFDGIEFQAGSAELLPAEQEKLKAIAKAMGERPRLKLVVAAPFAPDTDGTALKQEMTDREVARAMGRSLEPGETPAPVAIETFDAQRALERLLDQKAGAGVERDLVAQHLARTGAEPKRVSIFFRRVGDPKFYESVFSWLFDTQPVAGEALQGLAERRATSVIDHLRAAGVPAERLQSAPAAPGALEEAERISAGLSLELAEEARTTALSTDPEA